MVSVLSNSSGKDNIHWTSSRFNGGTSPFVNILIIRTAAERDMLARNRAVHIWFSTFIDKNADLHSFSSASSDLILDRPPGSVDNRFYRSSICTRA